MLGRDIRPALLLAAIAFGCVEHAAPPVALVAPASRAHVGVPVLLDGSASHSQSRRDGPPLALWFRWTLESAPDHSRARLQDPGLAKASLVPDVPGTYRIRLIVSDGVDSSAPASVSFVADDACRPVPAQVTATPAAPAVGQAVALFARLAPSCDVAGAATITASRWALVQKPLGSAAALDQDATVETSFTPDTPGRYVVSVQLTNALGLTTQAGDPAARVSVVAGPCGDNPPVVTALDSFPASAGVGSEVELSSEVTDADTEPPCSLHRHLSYSWSLSSLPPGSHVVLSDADWPTTSFRPDVAGNYVAELVVRDDAGQVSAPSHLTVSVNACGAGLPSATVVAPATAFVGEPVPLQAPVADPDASQCGMAIAYAFAWSLAVPAGSRAHLDDPTRPAPSFVPDVPGTYDASVVVTASTGRKSSRALASVLVGPCGSLPPEVTIASPAGAATGLPVRLQANVSDANDACVTTAPFNYAWTFASRPAGSHASLSGADSQGSSPQADPSFVPDLPGDYQVTLVVRDQAGLASAPTSATVSVEACTAPLSATIVAPAGAVTGAPTVFDATVSDPDGPGSGTACTRPVLPYSYAWRLVGQPAASHATLENPIAAAPTLVPDVDGTYEVELVVTDAAGNTSPPARARLSVATCRALLSVEARAQAVAGTGSPVALSATVDDPNAPAAGRCPAVVTPYSYRWTLLARPEGSQAELNDPVASDPSFVPDVPGTYAASVVVTDAAGNVSAPASASVDVENCQAPLSVTVTAPAGVATGQPAALSALVVDPNAPSVSSQCPGPVAPYAFRWSMVARPPGSRAALDSQVAASPSFTPDLAGTYSFEVAVEDAQGNESAPATFDVIAANCTAPLTATIEAPAGAQTGSPVAVSARVTDPNDPSLNSACAAAVTPYAYAWSLVAKPAGSQTALNAPGVASPSFTPDVAGAYTVALQVADQQGNQSLIAQAEVVAGNCTAPLTVSIAAPGTAGTRQPVTLSATVSDPNAGAACPSATEPYRYAWSLVGRPVGSTASLGAPASPTPSFTPDKPGTYVVTVDVVDAAGNRAPTATASVQVLACNQPLGVALRAPAGLATGVAAAFTAEVTDPNTPGEGACTAAVSPYVYQWQLISRPQGSAAALNDAVAASPSLTADVAGNYTVGLTVADAAGNESPLATATVAAVDCTAAPQVSIDAVAGAETWLAVPLSATVTDANGSPACAAATAPYAYRWALTAPVGSAAALNSTVAASPAFVPDVAGDYGVALAVTDAEGNVSQTAQRTVTVGSCTSPPIAVIAPVTNAQTGVPMALTATVDDPNDPKSNPSCTSATTPFSYLWSLSEAPKGSQASLSSMIASAPTLVPDLGGDYTVSLVVTDALGVRSVAASTTFAVLGCNAAPTVGLASSVSGGVATVTASPTDPNPAACAASGSYAYSWRLISTPPGYQTAFDRPDLASADFAATAAGTYVVEASVTDARGNVGMALTGLTVGACSTGPQVTAAADATTAIVGQRIHLSAAVADNSQADCGGQTAAPFSYAWSITTPPGSLATIEGNGRASFLADLPGTYTWTVVITDAYGLTGTASGTVTVVDCTLTPQIQLAGSAPYLTYEPVAVNGWVTRANPTCTNPATLLWQVTSAPPGSRASFASPTAAATSLTPDVPNGTWELELTATDEVTGAKTSATATLTSNGCGSRMPFAAAGISLPFPIAMKTPQPNPAAGALAAYLQNFTGTTTTLQLDASGSGDPSTACAGPLTYHWSTFALPAGSTSFWPTPTDAAKPSFALDQVGDYVVKLVVSDGRFTSAPSFLHIVVQNPLQDEVPSVTLGTTVRWNDSAVDPADGHPSAAYYQINPGTNMYDLYFTHCVSNCSAEGIGSNWTPPQVIAASILDPNNDAGIGVNTAQVSMVYLGPGMPAVAYHEIQGPNPCSMMYAVYSGGAWSRTQIDTTDVPGWCDGVNGQVEMHLMNGAPAVAYHSHSNGSDLGDKFAVCTANCDGAGAVWVTQWVEHSATWGNISFNAGHFTTMYVDPVTQLPRMAYEQGGQGSGDGPLRYATCADASSTKTCAKAQGTWSFQTLDTAGAVDYWNQLALSPKGTPSIVSDDTTTNQVKLWTCTSNCDDAPTSTWTNQLVQVVTGGGNAVTRLQYDSAGLTHITFIDPGTQTLEYAIQIDPSCTTGPNCFNFYNIDNQVDEGHSSFILTPAGSTHVTYSLTTGLKYYPFGD